MENCSVKLMHWMITENAFYKDMQSEAYCESSCEIALLFALIELIKITHCITSIQNQIYYWLPIDFLLETTINFAKSI